MRRDLRIAPPNRRDPAVNDRETQRSVVKIVGRAVLGSIAATVYLAVRVLDQAKGSGSPDAATIGLVGTTAAFATLGLGYLGGLLSNTRTTPSKAEIEEALSPFGEIAGGLPVTGPDGGSVLTAPVPAPGPEEAAAPDTPAGPRRRS